MPGILLGARLGAENRRNRALFPGALETTSALEKSTASRGSRNWLVKPLPSVNGVRLNVGSSPNALCLVLADI